MGPFWDRLVGVWWVARSGIVSILIPYVQFLSVFEAEKYGFFVVMQNVEVLCIEVRDTRLEV